MDNASGSRPLEQRPGYVLKMVDAVLRTALTTALAPHDLTVAQYACLEVALRHPGASAAELARRAFVSRQAMHQILTDLRSRDLVHVAEVPHRARPVTLTDAGRQAVQAAAGDVLAVEERMVATLTAGQRAHLLSALYTCAESLTDET
ncbi:MarR family protein [Actinomadura rubteroloni]|uniref:MarR family protein n=1 Tax=Actinomadura rubteroloni TaxID=1926885 RepID=A0A2P4UGU8_9ACTN|nr:MarR family winged helix-turn-helix transcriptional regulator [Actinomadura rubteroloni]POM24260.1 MarR family protein [Actinomadura rubteroloni]